jgi:CRISPR-associated helicase Cas3
MPVLVDEAFNRWRYPDYALIILEAPTGYGKTSSADQPYLMFKDCIVGGMIYVAPFRALVRQQARTWLPKYREMGLSITYQSMDIKMEIEISGGEKVSLLKNPKLDSDINISTLDSFTYNLLRMPVGDLHKSRWYYPIYRRSIFTSYVFLDEAHILAEGSGPAFATLALIVAELLRSFTPTVIATATLGDPRLEALLEVLENYGFNDKVRIYRLGPQNEDKGKEVLVHDKEFEESTSRLHWSLDKIDESTVLRKVNESVSSGDRVLILRNKVVDAVETYNALVKEFGVDSVVLLHGKLDEHDRDVNAMRMSNAKIIIGTDAIGVGVNLPDIKTLVMDVPDQVDVFIQRIGRICRDRNVSEDVTCKVYAIKSGDNVPGYKDALDNFDKINWRLPYKYRGKIGYLELLNKFVDKPRIDYKVIDNIESLLWHVVVEEEKLRNAFKKHCNLIRNSVLLRGFTNIDENDLEGSLTYSLPISINDAREIIRKAHDNIGLVILKWDVDDGVKRLTDVEKKLREDVIEELTKEGNDCVKILEIDKKINKEVINEMPKRMNVDKTVLIWGLDVSKLYRRGLGLVI